MTKIMTEMTNEQIEIVAKETCGGLNRFFAMYCCDVDENIKARMRSGNNKAYRFRKGQKLSVLEMEKLLQLKADYDKRQLIKK